MEKSLAEIAGVYAGARIGMCESENMLQRIGHLETPTGKAERP